MMRLKPLALTLETKSFETAGNGILAIFFFVMAYSFMPSSNIMFIVMEREDNI